MNEGMGEIKKYVAGLEEAGLGFKESEVLVGDEERGDKQTLSQTEQAEIIETVIKKIENLEKSQENMRDGIQQVKDLLNKLTNRKGFVEPEIIEITGERIN